MQSVRSLQGLVRAIREPRILARRIVPAFFHSGLVPESELNESHRRPSWHPR